MPWACEVSSTKWVSLNGATASASDHRDSQKTTRKPKKALGLSSLSKTQHFCQFISCVSSTKDSTTGQQRWGSGADSYSAHLYLRPQLRKDHILAQRHSTTLLGTENVSCVASGYQAASTVGAQGFPQGSRLDLHSPEAPQKKGNTGTLCKSGIKSWYKERINMSRVRRRFWAKVGVSKVAFSPLITETKGKGALQSLIASD